MKFWKNWPYWIKGAVLGLGVYLIGLASLLVSEFFGIFLPTNLIFSPVYLPLFFMFGNQRLTDFPVVIFLIVCMALYCFTFLVIGSMAKLKTGN